MIIILYLCTVDVKGHCKSWSCASDSCFFKGEIVNGFIEDNNLTIILSTNPSWCVYYVHLFRIRHGLIKYQRYL